MLHQEKNNFSEENPPTSKDVFIKFIEETTDFCDEGATHQIYFQPYKTLKIKTSNTESFWDKYCSLVYQYSDSDITLLRLGEIPGKHIPITVRMTLHLKFTKNGLVESFIPNDFIKFIVKVFQNVIIENLAFNKAQDQSKKLFCCVMTSQEIYEKENLDNYDINLVFPYCVVDKEVIINRIYDNVKKILLRSEYDDKFERGIKLLNQSSFMDNNAVMKPWPMYGSIIEENRPKMEFLNVFGHSSENLELDDIFDPKEHSQINSLNMTANAEYWLPLITSLHFHKEITEPAPVKEQQALIEYDESPFNGDDPKNTVLHMLPLIKPERFSDQCIFLEIGKSIHYSFEESKEGYDLWIKYIRANAPEMFNTYTEKHLNNNYFGKFKGIDEGRVTHRTIAWLAREDNKKKYLEKYNKWVNGKLHEAIKGSSSSDIPLARALLAFLWLDCLCVNPKKNDWYYFRRGRWQQMNDASWIKCETTDSFLQMILDYRSILAARAAVAAQDLRSRFQKLIDNIGKVSTRLDNGTSIEKLIKAAKSISFVRNGGKSFEDFRDKNPNLLGIYNGVIECGDHVAVFRKSKPEDFVTKMSNVRWDPRLHINDPKVMEVMNWIQQIFRDPTDKEDQDALVTHFMKFSASLLKSGNDNKLFPVFTGDGDNSKSMIKKVYEEVFGDYSKCLPASILMQRGSSNGLNPAMDALRGAKIAWVQETDNSESLKGGILKGMTGKDTFFSRSCNSNGGDNVATFVLIMMCNNIPTIPSSDNAIKNRMMVFPFGSTWSKSAPLDEEEQWKTRTFKLDPKFDWRIPELAPAFLWLLVDKYYQMYVSDDRSLQVPKQVKMATDEYWQNNDIYILFENSRIKTDDDDVLEADRGFIDEDALYRNFKDWYEEKFNNKAPPMPSVISEFSSKYRWGKPIKCERGKIWRGKKLKGDYSSM